MSGVDDPDRCVGSASAGALPAIPAVFVTEASASVPAVRRSVALEALGGGSGARSNLAFLIRTGAIEVVAPRVYCLPFLRSGRFGVFTVRPGLRDVALAFCTERGWRSAPGLCTSLNGVGLSTQVPAREIVAADGCDGTFFIAGGRILIEPAPDFVFGWSWPTMAFMQAVRGYEVGGSFSFQGLDPFDGPVGVMRAARIMASRFTDVGLEGLAADVGKLPEPYRQLLRAVLRSADLRNSA